LKLNRNRIEVQS